MTRRMAIAGLSAAVFMTSSFAAAAAPCGPAVLSKVDGKVLVNRGVGFMDGAAGMPLAVGDHVMLRSGTAEILFVNGTGSALSGAKSMAITACSADASRLTSPALAQAGGAGGSAGLSAAGGIGGAGAGGVGAGLTTGVVIAGGIAVAGVAAIAVGVANDSGDSGTVVAITPATPTSP